MSKNDRYQNLIAFITEAREARKLSERAFCRECGISEQAIKSLRAGHKLSVDVLQKITDYLGTSSDALMALANEEAPEYGVKLPRVKSALALSDNVAVIGQVQAGTWRPALEWSGSDRFHVSVPQHPILGKIQRYALMVNGDSMDKVYPHGTIIIVASYIDIGRNPRPGERVICVRRDLATGEFEATVKEYAQGLDGQHMLWPRSNNPEHQAPIYLPSLPHLGDPDRAHISFNEIDLLDQDAETIITGLVIQHIGNERIER